MPAPRLSFLALASVILAACASGEPAAEADPLAETSRRQEPAGEPDPGHLSPEPQVAGTRWTLFGFATSDTIEPLPSGIEATLEFEQDRLAGSGGCNRYNGSYGRTETELIAGPIASTRMACPGPRMDVERRFLQLLGAPLRPQIRDGRLWLHHRDGSALVFEPQAETD